MVRTPEQWLEILRGKKTNEEAAKQLLGDLTHYRNGGNYETDDRQQVINFMIAAANLAMRP